MKRKILITALLCTIVMFSACSANNPSGASDSASESQNGGIVNSGNCESGDVGSGETENDLCVVVFDTAGGSAIEAQTVIKGGKVTKPDDPSKTPDSQYEYVFAGWYVGEEEWDFESDIVGENITLTAKWEVESIYTPPFTPSD